MSVEQDTPITDPHLSDLEQAWGVIANAGWDDQPDEWVEAAKRWRDDVWHKRLSERHVATTREILALGWLSAEFAARSDAWAGNAPEWFPEPPEWIELWQRALEATKDAS